MHSQSLTKNLIMILILYTIDSNIKKAINGNEDVLRYQFVNPVCKMVRRELVEKNAIQFQEVPASNDLMFSVMTGHYASKVKAVDKIVYVITVGEVGSSLTRTLSVCLDMSPRILGFVLKGYRLFGVKTGTKWLSYALKHKVNIFRGI